MNFVLLEGHPAQPLGRRACVLANSCYNSLQESLLLEFRAISRPKIRLFSRGWVMLKWAFAVVTVVLVSGALRAGLYNPAEREEGKLNPDFAEFQKNTLFSL